MKYYVQFKTINNKGILWDATGSDGVFILDGRNSLENMIIDANERMKQLSKVRTFKGFDIIRGDKIRDGNTVMYRVAVNPHYQGQLGPFYE